MLEKIKDVIASDVQPYLESHGGSIEIIRLDSEGNLIVKLTGACSHCPASQVTMDNLVSTALKAKVPGVNRVLIEEQPVSKELLDITLDILRGGKGGILHTDKN